MTANTTAASHKVPFGQKVAFGLGMLANQMFPAALGIFMVVLVQDMGFPGWMWGVLFFLPRVFDSVTDPIMGFISDNTRSTWGRRKQYVFIGAIVMGISFVAMWQLYRVDGISYNRQEQTRPFDTELLCIGIDALSGGSMQPLLVLLQQAGS